MQIINEQTELVDVRSLKPHPKNPNQGSADLIAESITENGFYGQIIAQRSTGHILVGHHRLQAAQQLGAKEVPVTWVDVDNTRALKIMLADNKTAEAAHRDEEALAALLSELKLTDDLTGTGYADADLDSLIASIADNTPAAEPVEAPEPQEDRAEELRAKWGTERGQLWLIPSKTVPGKAHRLLCGDSTNAEDVARLMDGQKADMVWTDPPYGMRLDADYSSMVSNLKFSGDKKALGGNKYTPVAGDHDDFTPALITTVFKHFPDVAEVFLWGADYYAELLPERNEGSWVIWDKRLDESADKMFGSGFETCWSKARHKRDIARIKWAGIFGMEKEQEKTRQHPTQKPVELARWFFDRWGDKGDTVVDLYMGSGAALIASEQTARLCYGMELEAKYIAVILERLSGMGLTPELQ